MLLTPVQGWASRCLLPPGPVAWMPTIVTDDGNSDEVGKHSEQNVIRETLQITSSKPTRIEMVMLGKFPRVFDCFGQLIPKFVGKHRENLVVVFDHLSNLGRNTRVIHDDSHVRPTSERNCSWEIG